MSHTTVKVIVSKCVWDRHAESWRAWDRVSDVGYPTLEQAMERGILLKGEKLSVIVRPTYNEEDSEGRFFREWRSFNGEPFQECKWYFGR